MKLEEKTNCKLCTAKSTQRSAIACNYKEAQHHNGGLYNSLMSSQHVLNNADMQESKMVWMPIFHISGNRKKQRKTAARLQVTKTGNPSWFSAPPCRLPATVVPLTGHNRTAQNMKARHWEKRKLESSAVHRAVPWHTYNSLLKIVPYKWKNVQKMKKIRNRANIKIGTNWRFCEYGKWYWQLPLYHLPSTTEPGLVTLWFATRLRLSTKHSSFTMKLSQWVTLTFDLAFRSANTLSWMLKSGLRPKFNLTSV